MFVAKIKYFGVQSRDEAIPTLMKIVK